VKQIAMNNLTETQPQQLDSSKTISKHALRRQKRKQQKDSQPEEKEVVAEVKKTQEATPVDKKP
jgi:hypothetical protein